MAYSRKRRINLLWKGARNGNAPASQAKPPVEKLDPKVVKTALILILGGMAVIFDTTIVSVALHTLAAKLDTSVATIQWVTTGYLLALANAGTDAGFGHPNVIIPLVIGAALIAAFTVYALRKARPLVEIRLLAKRSVASSSAALFCSGFSLYGAMLLLPLFTRTCARPPR